MTLTRSEPIAQKAPNDGWGPSGLQGAIRSGAFWKCRLCMTHKPVASLARDCELRCAEAMGIDFEIFLATTPRSPQ